MDEFLGALAFAALVAGYVLAVVFVRHEDDGGVDENRSVRHEEGSNLPPVSSKGR